jgi:hypothetical protein
MRGRRKEEKQVEYRRGKRDAKIKNKRLFEISMEREHGRLGLGNN